MNIIRVKANVAKSGSLVVSKDKYCANPSDTNGMIDEAVDTEFMGTDSKSCQKFDSNVDSQCKPIISMFDSETESSVYNGQAKVTAKRKTNERKSVMSKSRDSETLAFENKSKRPRIYCSGVDYDDRINSNLNSSSTLTNQKETQAGPDEDEFEFRISSDEAMVRLNCSFETPLFKLKSANKQNKLETSDDDDHSVEFGCGHQKETETLPTISAADATKNLNAFVTENLNGLATDDLNGAKEEARLETGESESNGLLPAVTDNNSMKASQSPTDSSDIIVEIQPEACKDMTLNSHYLLDETFSRCYDCKIGEGCRFKDFRRIKRIRINGANMEKIEAAGFPSVTDQKTMDRSIWHAIEDDSSNRMTLEDAKICLEYTKDLFWQLCCQDRVSSCCSSNAESLPIYKDVDSRTLCDNCMGAIFNRHAMCTTCGLDVCENCFQDVVDAKDCEDSLTKKHNFFLACLVPEDDAPLLLGKEMNEMMTKYNLVPKEPKRRRKLDNDEMEKNQDNGNLWEYYFNDCPDMQMLVIKNYNSSNGANALKLFQEHWPLAKPVVVQNLFKRKNEICKLSSPAKFKRLVADRNTKGTIVDCRHHCNIDCSTEDFFSGFSNENLQPTYNDDNENDLPRLKLKDFPKDCTFKELSPQLYDLFTSIIPFSADYTHLELGRRNLVTYLPSRYVKPDLGPKTYCAYGMIHYDEKFDCRHCATTNLHTDITDALNVCLFANNQIPLQASKKQREYAKALRCFLEETKDLDKSNLNRALNNLESVGAIWTIFHPDQTPEINEFLRKNAKETENDAVNMQTCFLDYKMRKNLFDEFGVRGFTFVQNIGDAVFIPAGAPHQVQNLNSCIKIALDFCSPENLFYSAKTNATYRRLPKDNLNYADKLQLPHVIFHSVRAAVGRLLQEERKNKV